MCAISLELCLVVLGAAMCSTISRPVVTASHSKQLMES